MNCNDLRERLVDVAAGAEAPEDIRRHVDTCSACAHTLNELRATMALLDEWQAPEPSPYFNTRLQARLREEQSREAASWLDWFRKPVLGIAAALLIAVGVGLFQGGQNLNNSTAARNAPPTAASEARFVAAEGTAVGDLQLLDKNSDVLQDFDALDALDGTMDNSSQVN